MVCPFGILEVVPLFYKGNPNTFHKNCWSVAEVYIGRLSKTFYVHVSVIILFDLESYLCYVIR